MRPLSIEPVTSLVKCRVTFYWVTLYPLLIDVYNKQTEKFIRETHINAYIPLNQFK